MNESTPTSKKTLMSEKRAHNSKVSLLGEHQEEIWDRTPKFTRMNSLECWDYTIELECLNGPQGSSLDTLFKLDIFSFSHIFHVTSFLTTRVTETDTFSVPSSSLVMMNGKSEN